MLTTEDLRWIVEHFDDDGYYIPTLFTSHDQPVLNDLIRRHAVRWRTSGRYWLVGQSWTAFRGIQLSRLLHTVIVPVTSH